MTQGASDNRNAQDRAEALRLCPCLAKRRAEFDVYASLLRKWQETINLVAAPTLDHLWTRHFADSAQIHDAFPQTIRWADLGSGGGFPGLVTAILLKGRDGAIVHLIESDQRKAAFLRAVSRETGAPTEIHVGRIEAHLPKLLGEIDGISARALASTPHLVALTEEHLLKSAFGAFLKGEDWAAELTGLSAFDNLSVDAIVSRTNPKARLIVVKKKPS